jgi:two-component system NtrC family sensor kinase
VKGLVRRQLRRGRGLPLWIKLAVAASVGVVLTHGVHLVVGSRVATRSLAREQETLGRAIARLVASSAADAILTHDTATLGELVARAAGAKGVAYCFVVRDGEVLATSFPEGTPAALVDVRTARPPGPVVMVDGEARYLDLEEPVLGGKLGTVRLGLEMDLLQSTRRAIAVPLGLLAAFVILGGIAASLLIGRSLARPIEEIVAAADRFDPAGPLPLVARRGGREVGMLAGRFNRMMIRLRAAHHERERLRRRALAHARLASLGEVVAGVAHEVNNPLASLKACVGILRESCDDAAHAEDLALMDAALDRIRDVVRRLLELGSPRPLDLSPTSLLDLMREAPQLAALSLRGKGVELEEAVDPAAVDVPVLADRKQISQALLNLLLNAAYVSPPGSRVRVRTTRRDGFRGIAIEDRGPGIPADLRERVFEPFFTTKPGGEGTGLGLPLARTIVDLHHGSLELECPAGGGTVATIWLPVADGPAAAARPAESSCAVAGAA